MKLDIGQGLILEALHFMLALVRRSDKTDCSFTVAFDFFQFGQRATQVLARGAAPSLASLVSKPENLKLSIGAQVFNISRYRFRHYASVLCSGRLI